MRRALPIVIACLITGCAGAAPQSSPELPNAAVLETHALLFRAARLNATVLVEIALPQTERASDPPVIFTLDGETTFALVAAAAQHLARRGEIPPAIVVGIHSGMLSAAPETIIDFITTDLTRYLESERHLDSARNVLVGYGASAGMVLTALFGLPTSFHGYLVVSPSLGSGDYLALEAEYASGHDDLPARIFFGVEGLEMDPPPGAAAALVTAMTNHIRRRGYPGLDNETVIFAGENQASVLPAAISRGLRFLYRQAVNDPP